MKKQILSVLTAILLLAGMAGVSKAALTTIGTASYNSSNYNLIYDADSPTGPITWLDYSKSTSIWYKQIDWANNLGASLTVILNSGYTTDIDWATGWRLPSIAGANSESPYNQTTSEIGNLFYNHLNLQSYPDRGNSCITDEELNATNFDNLSAFWYWYGTDHASPPFFAWAFNMSSGGQSESCLGDPGYGLAVRSGQVSATPVPGAVWLLGSGLAGVVVLARQRKGRLI